MALDPFHHSLDHPFFEFLETIDTKLPLPSVNIFGHEFQFTKFMVIELFVAVAICAIYIPLARRARSGEPPRGPFANAFEFLLTFIRDDVARPSIGEEEADHYVPFLWTTFLFILFCNLFGLLPYLGSPTGSITVTATLAIIAFVVIHGVPIVLHGPVHYLKTFIPHIDLGDGLVMKLFGLVITAFMFFIELVSAVIRGSVLAIRLFANMLGGHTVLGVVLGFIVLVAEAGSGFFTQSGITVVSVLMVLALSLLELFVAFLQAFIFTFLTALFIGMALHPEH
jgi:F-type H+-transporting ATPase subunit a